jgi:hypothetical protein
MRCGARAGVESTGGPIFAVDEDIEGKIVLSSQLPAASFG